VTLAIQAVFSSLVNGSVYVLIGIGIVLCYRSSRVVNLAQGETYSISGLLTAKLVIFGVPLLASGLCGIVAAVVFSLGFERLALRSRLDWNPRRLIIVTLGVALLTEGVAELVVNSDTYVFPAMLNGPSFRLDGAAISQQEVVAVALAFVACGALVWFFRSTLVGNAMTACAENPRTASTLGINVARMRQFSFGIAGLLGGVTALLLVPLTELSYNSGLSITLYGFLAAAFADMQHPGRVLWGGMALGLCEGFVGAYWNPLYEVPVVLGVVLIVGVLYLSRGVRFGGALRA
jgi:branched-subunit amino acid ABC-type transport system permease component